MILLSSELNAQEFINIIKESEYYNEYLELTHRTTKHYDENGKYKGFEHHHIIPKCFGGSDDDSNIAKLTIKEHLLAHYYLALMTRHIHMFHAFNYMMGKQFKQLSQLEAMELEELNKWAEIRGESRRRKFSEKARATMSEKAKKRWESFRRSGRIDEIKKNISKSTKDAMQSKDAKIKVRANLGCKIYYNPETDEEMHWYEGDPTPEFPWRRGRRGNSQESRKKLSETLRKSRKRWYYNDELQINRTFNEGEPIPDGWKPGQPTKYRGNYTKLKKQKSIDILNSLKTSKE